MKNIQASIASEKRQLIASKKYRTRYKLTHASGVKRLPRGMKLNKSQLKARKKARTRTASLRFKKENRVGKEYQLYALQLENNKYYVGLTAYKDVMCRLIEHASGGIRSALWTKLHKPLYVIETRQLGVVTKSYAAIQENELTVDYLLKYGVDNVRGGDMCSIDSNKIMKNFARHISYRERALNNPYVPQHIRQIQQEEW